MFLTRYGFKEIILASLSAISLMVCCYLLSLIYDNLLYFYFAIIPMALWFWVLWFFRDPIRKISTNPFDIVSPADGVVTHIDEVTDLPFIEGKAWRLSIFLSIFNVHVNRSPVAGSVAYLQFTSGSFFDARDPRSLDKNQNQDLGIIATNPDLPNKFLVRQSTGAIARRIVCDAKLDENLTIGQKYGMIKFGSRTTLFISQDKEINFQVKIGDKVKGGKTVIANALSQD